MRSSIGTRVRPVRRRGTAQPDYVNLGSLFDEDYQGLGHDAVVLHRLARCPGLHRGHEGFHAIRIGICVGLYGLRKLPTLVTPKGPKNSSRFGEARQWSLPFDISWRPIMVGMVPPRCRLRGDNGKRRLAILFHAPYLCVNEDASSWRDAIPANGRTAAHGRSVGSAARRQTAVWGDHGAQKRAQPIWDPRGTGRDGPGASLLPNSLWTVPAGHQGSMGLTQPTSHGRGPGFKSASLHSVRMR